MRSINRNLLSFGVIILFAIFAVASKANKIHYGAFNYSNKVEDRTETQNYLLQNDGTKIYGNSISWKSGLVVKDQIKIDDQKFKISEIIGYRKGDTYYGRLGKEYIQRIVHGKVNVYVQFTQATSTSTDRNGFSHTRSYTRTDQYAQRGETGPMMGLAGQKEIKEVVSDCPAAYALADLSNKGMRKAIKADHNYLNKIFDVYNNDCK
jgi:hypothetical protein